MSKTTPATQALTKAGIAFTAHVYDYHKDVERIGLAAAEAIGIAPERVFKTLMLVVDGKPACVVLPSDRETSMKKAAQAFGGKSAEMMKPAEAERITGYHVGGISPFGQRKRVPVAVDETLMDFPSVVINGGQRGMLVELAPTDAVKVLNAKVEAICA